MTTLSRTADAQDEHRRQDVSAGGNPVPQDSATKTAKVERKQLVAAVEGIAEFLHKLDRKLEFRLDSDIDRTIVTVVDAETEEIVRQIPAQEVVEMARYLAEVTPDVVMGLLLNSQA
jgi:flagellar protein FlaG